MENLTKLRPPLPGTTPTPSLSFNKTTNNVYASTTSLHLTNPESSFNLNQTADFIPKDDFADVPPKDNIALQRSAQEKIISKMIRKLPYDGNNINQR